MSCLSFLDRVSCLCFFCTDNNFHVQSLFCFSLGFWLDGILMHRFDITNEHFHTFNEFHLLNTPK